MKSIKIIYVTALLLVGFAACKDDDPVLAPEGIKGVANDTIQIDYNGKLDLNSLFSIEPAGAAGTLSYGGLQQPQRKDGLNEWETVNAYALSGSELTSVADVRVPDAFYATDTRSRQVTQGTLKVSILGNTAISEKTVVIVQKNKPTLTPSAITLVNPDQYVAGPDGKLLVLQTVGVAKAFTASAFNVEPIDFDPLKIHVRPKPGSSYIHPPGAATSAGGLGGEIGEGDYVIAFYCESTNAADIQAACDQAVAGTIASAKLYVNVEYVAPNAVVGIVPNTEAIGKKATASFWRNNANGRQLASSFIKVKLNNGDIVPYVASTHGAVELVAGEFDEYLEGRTTEDPTGWWNYVALKLAGPLPDVGTEVSFTVSRKGDAYLQQPDWTVKITTKTVSQNPETL